MAALRLSPLVLVPTHQVGHMVDLSLKVGIIVDLITTEAVPLHPEDLGYYSKPYMFEQ